MRYHSNVHKKKILMRGFVLKMQLDFFKRFKQSCLQTDTLEDCNQSFKFSNKQLMDAKKKL